MSHYLNIKTAIRDKDALIRALMRVRNAMGRTWTENQIEVHEEPVNLYGYHGDMRKDKANIIIRRHNVQDAANDIGFVREADGTYRAIISEYDSGYYNQAWMGKVSAFYGCEKMKREMISRGVKYAEKVDAKGQPQLVAILS